MADTVYDKKDQYERIKAHLVPGEILYLVYDMKGGGTGFVGVTDRRLIFQDSAFLGKKRSMVSLPFTQITAVGVEESGGFFSSSTLQILSSAREWEFQFRSADKAYQAYQYIMRNLHQEEAAGVMGPAG